MDIILVLFKVLCGKMLFPFCFRPFWRYCDVLSHPFCPDLSVSFGLSVRILAFLSHAKNVTVPHFGFLSRAHHLTRSSRSYQRVVELMADYSDQQQTARCRSGCKGGTKQWWTYAWDGTRSASTGWHCDYLVSAIPLRRLWAYQMHALEQGRWDALSALGHETQSDLRRFDRDHRGWR